MRVKCLWDGACVALGKSTLGVKHGGKKTHKKSLYLIYYKDYEYISSGFYSIIFSIYQVEGIFLHLIFEFDYCGSIFMEIYQYVSDAR